MLHCKIGHKNRSILGPCAPLQTQVTETGHIVLMLGSSIISKYRIISRNSVLRAVGDEQNHPWDRRGGLTRQHYTGTYLRRSLRIRRTWSMGGVDRGLLCKYYTVRMGGLFSNTTPLGRGGFSATPHRHIPSQKSPYPSYLEQNLRRFSFFPARGSGLILLPCTGI